MSPSIAVKEFLEKAKEDFEEKWKNPSKVSGLRNVSYEQNLSTCMYVCTPLCNPVKLCKAEKPA